MSLSLPYGLRRCPTVPPHPPPEHQGEPSGLCVSRCAGPLFIHCEPTFCAEWEVSNVMIDKRMSLQQESKFCFLFTTNSTITVSLWMNTWFKILKDFQVFHWGPNKMLRSWLLPSSYPPGRHTWPIFSPSTVLPMVLKRNRSYLLQCVYHTLTLVVTDAVKSC